MITKHGRGEAQNKIDDSANGAGVAVTSRSELVVVTASGGITASSNLLQKKTAFTR